MSFFSESTAKIKGKIASLKAVIEKGKNKYDDLYSKGKKEYDNLMGAVMEIYTQLGGYKDMIETIEIILSKKLNDIEKIIKSAIKISLKETISCSVEPSIGDLLINTGVTFELNNIDPISVLNIDPQSENGSYAYYDNNSGVKSKDFNVFLYSIIRKSLKNKAYTGAIWYKNDVINNESVKKPLFNLSYKEYDEETKKSNIITIKLDESLRGQKLNYFISEYLDSVKLFNNVQIISAIFDDILGTKILSINKSVDQLLVEDQIKQIVDNIINNLEDDTYEIDDGYYEFSNDTYNEMLETANKKKQGVFNYNNLNLEIDQETLFNSLDGLKVDDLSITEQTKVLTDTINNITDELISNSSISNEFEISFKMDIITKIINKLMNTITMSILSPKIIFLFELTSVIFGLEKPSNVIDFIKKNVKIFKLIILAIRDTIINALINKIKQMIAPMISKMILELTKERFAIYKKQLLSLKKIIKK